MIQVSMGRLIKLLGLICLSLLICTACTSTDTIAEKGSDDIALSELDDSIESSNGASDTELLSLEKSYAETTISDMEMYESFLRNEALAVIDKKSDIGKNISYSQSLEDGESYNLHDIVQAVLDDIASRGNQETWLDSIKYTYIDCGNDGEQELAIRISMPAAYPEWWNECLILKCIDGKLHVCYADDYWYRSDLKINQYGFITWNDYVGESQNPSADYLYKYSVVDGGGKWHYLYSVDVLSDYALSVYSGIDDFGEEENNLLLFAISFDEYDNHDSIYTYALRKDPRSEFGNKDVNFYPIQVRYYDTYYADNSILGMSVKTDINIQSMDRVQGLVAERDNEYDVTDEIKSGDVVVWDYLRLPESMWDLQPSNDNFLNIHCAFPIKMTFASGVGAWATRLTIEKDGSFVGIYNDADMQYIDICEFTGKFGNVKEINDYTLSMDLLELETKNYPEAEWVEDTEWGTLYYSASTPYGLDDNGKTYHIYLPFAKISDMNNDFMSWYYVYPQRDCLGGLGMYDVDGDNHYGFYEEKTY